MGLTPGDGKSWLSQTAPGPRLVIDAEGGAEYTFGRKVVWENPNDPPPVADGAWDTCVLRVQRHGDVQRAYQWLARGEHPFVTVIIDSLSELQKRIVDEVSGTEQAAPQDWGEIFRRGEALVRRFRDLVFNPVKPVLCVCYLAGPSERGRAEIKVTPYVRGQLGQTLPGFVDVIGYLKVEDTAEGPKHRLYVHPERGKVEVDDGFKTKVVDWRTIAKDRTHTFRDGVVDVTFNEERGWTNTIESMMVQITETLEAREKGDAA